MSIRLFVLLHLLCVFSGPIRWLMTHLHKMWGKATLYTDIIKTFAIHDKWFISCTTAPHETQSDPTEESTLHFNRIYLVLWQALANVSNVGGPTGANALPMAFWSDHWLIHNTCSRELFQLYLPYEIFLNACSSSTQVGGVGLQCNKSSELCVCVSLFGSKQLQVLFQGTPAERSAMIAWLKPQLKEVF